MKNIFSEKVSVKENDPHFTGSVIQKTIVEKESKDFKMFYVQFLKGARTFVHSHSSDQILIACEGQGILVFLDKIKESDDANDKYKQKGKTIFLTKGDTVVVPKNIPHYHGSNDKNETFGHIAILSSKAESDWDEESSFPLK